MATGERGVMAATGIITIGIEPIMVTHGVTEAAMGGMPMIVITAAGTQVAGTMAVLSMAVGTVVVVMAVVTKPFMAVVTKAVVMPVVVTKVAVAVVMPVVVAVTKVVVAVVIRHGEMNKRILWPTDCRQVFM